MIKLLKNNLRIKLIISLILTFFMTAGHFIAFEYSWNPLLQLTLFLFLRLAGTYFFISVFYVFIDRLTAQKPKYEFFRMFFISFAVIFVLYFVSFLALYPGIFAFDAPGQLNMYFSDRISEWHPVLHTFLMGKIIEIAYSLGLDIISGIAIYTVFQFVVIDLCFSYMTAFIYEKCGNLFVFIFSVLFLGGFPTIVLQALSATKDSFFMCMFILAMTMTVEMISDPQTFGKSFSKQFFWVLSVLGMIIFRNNCIYAIPFFVVTLLTVSKEKKRTLLLFLCVLFGFLCYKLVFVRSIVSVEVTGMEKLSVPAQQIVKIYRENDSDISENERLIVEELFTPFGLENFIPESADIVKSSINVPYYNENSEMIDKMWLSLVFRNPDIAIRTVADLTVGYWYPVYDLTLFGQGGKGYWIVAGLSPYYIDSKIPFLLDYYSFFNYTDFTDTLMIPVYLLFAPAVFFYLFILMFGYCIVRRLRMFYPVFVFGLAYWCTFLLGPMVLVRYTTYMFAMVPIYFVLIFDKRRADS